MGKDDKILENNMLDDELLTDVSGGKKMETRNLLFTKEDKAGAKDTVYKEGKKNASNLLFKDDEKTLIDGIKTDGPKYC